MPIILFLLGLFLIIFGIIEILYPKYMLNFIYNYIHNGPIKLTAIIMAFLGTPMIIKYNTSHYPAPILLLGILITLKSISALILPRNTIIIIYNFFL